VVGGIVGLVVGEGLGGSEGVFTLDRRSLGGC